MAVHDQGIRENSFGFAVGLEFAGVEDEDSCAEVEGEVKAPEKAAGLESKTVTNDVQGQARPQAAHLLAWA